MREGKVNELGLERFMAENILHEVKIRLQKIWSACSTGVFHEAAVVKKNDSLAKMAKALGGIF